MRPIRETEQEALETWLTRVEANYYVIEVHKVIIHGVQEFQPITNDNDLSEFINTIGIKHAAQYVVLQTLNKV